MLAPKFNTLYWIRFSFLNLLIVASLGVLMRYKITFDFPFLDQKNIQHAHSHFAFAGWITHSLYVFLIQFVTTKIQSSHIKKYKILVLTNLLLSYSILFSFFFQGYGFISITLSTLLILNNCLITYYLFQDFKKILPNISVLWFKSALLFNLISSIGTFYLAYILASRNFNEHLYLAAIYFYLHFQYNGFFIFSCFGLAENEISKLIPSYKPNKTIFLLSLASCIPAYFLSTLWANLPTWLYIIVVFAAFIQVFVWIAYVRGIIKMKAINHHLPLFIKRIVLFIIIAFTIKLSLQLGSTVPSISKLAFGFRPVVIAYLHLVLLAVVSTFIIAYSLSTNLLELTRNTKWSIIVFLTGVLFNEVVLAIQGLAAFQNIPIRHINELLFIIAIVLFTGALMMYASISIRRKTVI